MLFMDKVLTRLRLGPFEEDLADHLDYTIKIVSRKIPTWVNYLYFEYGSINIWLPRYEIDRLMPNKFKNKLACTGVVYRDNA